MYQQKTFHVPVTGRESCPSKCEWIDRNGRCVQCGKQQNLELDLAVNASGAVNTNVNSEAK